MSKKYLLVVECILEYQNKYPIIKRPEGVHAAGLLAFPGGKVDEEDETNADADVLRNAAKREVLEEVGIKIEDPIHFVTSAHFEDDYGTQVVDSIFHCKIEKTNPTVIASEREVPEYAWMSKEEILAANNSPVWIKKYVNVLPA